jgi:hypothetical protein
MVRDLENKSYPNFFAPRLMGAAAFIASGAYLDIKIIEEGAIAF